MPSASEKQWQSRKAIGPGSFRAARKGSFVARFPQSSRARAQAEPARRHRAGRSFRESR
jgi:hypothetical protein